MDIVCFDFDGTLMFTQEPVTGKDIFKNKTGKDWPHQGWWSKEETLDPDIFHTPINPWVQKEYDKWSCSEGPCYVIMATGRIEKLRNRVQHILDSYDLSFKEVHLNSGRMETFFFKTNLFENLIKKHKPNRLIMYDDRQEHLYRFEQWAKDQLCEIHVVDVVNKTTKVFNKK